MKIKGAKYLVFLIFLHMNQDYVSGKIKLKENKNKQTKQKKTIKNNPCHG